MKKNMNGLDRIVRLVLIAIVAVLYYMNVISGTAAIILGISSVVLFLTSVVSFCPIYAIFGASTCDVKETK